MPHPGPQEDPSSQAVSDVALHSLPKESRKTGKFPKSARLLNSSQFKHLNRHSARYQGEWILVQFRQGRASESKLGITVSKKFGKAHDRNRFKRIVREAFREIYPLIPQELEMNVSPQKNLFPPTKQAILLDFQTLLSRIARS